MRYIAHMRAAETLDAVPAIIDAETLAEAYAIVQRLAKTYELAAVGLWEATYPIESYIFPTLHKVRNEGTARVIVARDGGMYMYRVGMGTIEGRPTWRFLGEGDDPIGPGSHGLIASWYDDQSSKTATHKLALVMDTWLSPTT